MKLPPGWSLTTLESKPSTPLPDLGAAVEGAVAQPLSAPRLIDLASPATRAYPDHNLVPAILRELDRAGVPDDHITLLCATGLHRPSTREEKIAKLGREVVERYRVIDHDVRHCEPRSGEAFSVNNQQEIASSHTAFLAMTQPDSFAVDPPKDVDLYQASRAATYSGLSATPPIRPSGVIIVAAQCPEGAGQGRGEERFFTALSQATDLRQLLAQYRRNGCQADEQRAYMLAQVLLNYEVVVAGSQCPQLVEACHLIAAMSLDKAIEYAQRRLGATAQVLYLPHPMQTIPSIIRRA